MGIVGNFPEPVALRDVGTNREFVFVGDDPTSYDRLWRLVVPPPTGTDEFGIKYQPTGDANSEYIVHVASGRLRRALGSLKVIPLPRGDVVTTVRVRDRWTYDKLET